MQIQRRKLDQKIAYSCRCNESLDCRSNSSRNRSANPVPEGTHRHRRIEYSRVTPDIQEKRECTSPGPGADFWLKYGRPTADFEEGRKHPPIQTDGSGTCISGQQSTVPAVGRGTCQDHEREKKYEGYNNRNHTPKRNCRDGSPVLRSHY